MVVCHTIIAFGTLGLPAKAMDVYSGSACTHFVTNSYCSETSAQPSNDPLWYLFLWTLENDNWEFNKMILKICWNRE